jgi:hypothetical protein
MRLLPRLTAAAWASLLLPLAAHSEPSAGACHVGAYRLADGSFVDIAPSQGDTLRWRRFDGTTGALHRQQDGSWSSTFGWTERPDGKQVVFGDCGDDKIRFDGRAGQRIPFDVSDMTFQSHGVTLAGRLVMPQRSTPVPVVVLLHGSEHDSARDSFSLQRMLPAEGIGAFVYDKRGTGASAGQYSQDFNLLADDAVAAMHEARRLAGARAGRVGYQGGSQGGWIAPLAAGRAPVDFVVVSFGLAVSVIDEDQEQIALEMSLKGHGPHEIAAAQEIGAAAEGVFASGFTHGFRQFDAVRARYRDEPWYKDVRGNYTWFFLPYSEAELRAKAQDFRWGTPFYYDPMPTLRALAVPQLWIVGTDDLEAPSAETSRRLRTLQAEGRPITLLSFPDAEHGMTEYQFDAAGERVSTRYAEGYFAAMRDFIRDGRVSGSYGAGVVTPPAGAAAQVASGNR